MKSAAILAQTHSDRNTPIGISAHGGMRFPFRPASNPGQDGITSHLERFLGVSILCVYFSSTIAASHGFSRRDWSWMTVAPCDKRFVPNP